MNQGLIYGNILVVVFKIYLSRRIFVLSKMQQVGVCQLFREEYSENYSFFKIYLEVYFFECLNWRYESIFFFYIFIEEEDINYVNKYEVRNGEI